MELNFEEMFEKILSNDIIDDADNVLWNKAISRMFWDKQQEKIDELTKTNKKLKGALVWMADSPSDEVIRGMKKETIISLFRLNEEKAKEILKG